MFSWPDNRLVDLLSLELPLVQAPMAGSDSIALAKSVCSAGGLGSLACALLTAEEVNAAVVELRAASSAPFNLNFFCHRMTPPEQEALERWKAFLRPHYEHFGLDLEAVPEARLRMPFDEEMCALIESLLPPVVSFHFGLPDPVLLQRLKQRGIRILSSATSVKEALWLEQQGCDAVVVQGAEAGGHRAMFLEEDPSAQPGLFALLPQVADALSVPVIAAGGIADGRGVAAAFALGASGVQMGTAYLLCPEAHVSALYRKALQDSVESETVLTNLFSGRPARGIQNQYLKASGPISGSALAFPYAASLIAPLRKASEQQGSQEYMQLWAGQALRLLRAEPAAELTRRIAAEAQQLLTHGLRREISPA